MHLIVDPITLKTAFVWPANLSFALLLASDKGTFIFSSVFPGFYAVAIRLIFSPLSIVNIAIGPLKKPATMSFSIKEIAFIDISVGMDDPSFALSSIV